LFTFAYLYPLTAFPLVIQLSKYLFFFFVNFATFTSCDSKIFYHSSFCTFSIIIKRAAVYHYLKNKERQWNANDRNTCFTPDLFSIATNITILIQARSPTQNR
jgi:hypothetical protein